MVLLGEHEGVSWAKQVGADVVIESVGGAASTLGDAVKACRKGGTILILNHFSGSRFWWLLERAVRSLADRIGFRSDFCYNEQVLRHDWEVLSARNVNFLGLSKLVTIRNV